MDIREWGGYKIELVNSRLPLPEVGFTLAAILLAGPSYAQFDSDRLMTALIVAAVIELSVFGVVAVIFVKNMALWVNGKTDARWGKAGFVLGALALLFALPSLGFSEGRGDGLAFGLVALVIGIPLCLLGRRNMKTAKLDEP